eukprot:COSAG04_NODE_6840_length_1244_cov_1.338865_1_plen_287_part_10
MSGAPQTPPPLSPHAAMAALPAELEELIGLPPFAECLASLEIASLQDFAETFDVEEGHDKTLRDALAGLPDKPKKKRIVKARSIRKLNELITRLNIFEEFDENGDGALSREEVAQIPHDRVVAKAGRTLAEAFDSMDVDGDGLLCFVEFFEGVKLVDSEGTPPASPQTPSSAGSATPGRSPVGGRTPGSAEPEPEATIHLWIKAPDGGTLRVVAENGLATTVAQMRAKVADTSGLDVSACRLIFAGKELEDRMSLADYNCEHASELNLILRVEEEDTSVDKEAERQV